MHFPSTVRSRQTSAAYKETVTTNNDFQMTFEDNNCHNASTSTYDVYVHTKVNAVIFRTM